MGNMKPLIGICAAAIQKEEVKELVRVICRYVEKSDYRVIVYSTIVDLYHKDSHAKGEAAVFDKIIYEDLTALVILGETIKRPKLVEKMVTNAKKNGVLVVSVDYDIPGCFNVCLDYQSSFEKIVRHVIEEHQCRRPYFMAGMKDNDFSNERIQIYKKVLLENKMDFLPRRVAYGDFWEFPSKKACEKWMEDTSEVPDAIICANDMMAITVCNVLKDHGLCVPEDVIVTGFDGFDLERFCTPRLTTAQINMEEVGQQCIDIITQYRRDNSIVPYTTKIPFHVRYSESCGCKQIQLIKHNNQIMEVYGRMSHNQQYVETVFAMMNQLTEGHSVMDLMMKLDQYLEQATDRAVLVCVNRKFCNHTDISFPKTSKRDSLLLLAKKQNGAYSVPMIELNSKNKQEVMNQFWEEQSQVIVLPLHWQEEDYGCLMLGHSGLEMNYQRLSEFILSVHQIFGSVRKQSQLHEMYLRDSLTKLYNRRGFYSQMTKQFKKLGRKQKKIFLVSVDLDNLKRINDAHGHSEGDYAIIRVAHMIEKCIKDKEGVCARFGGDEFVVAYIVEAGEESFEQTFKDRMEKEIVREAQKPNRGYRINASIGIVEGKISLVGEIDEWMKKADDRMYCCKERHHAVRESCREEEKY